MNFPFSFSFLCRDYYRGISLNNRMIKNDYFASIALNFMDNKMLFYLLDHPPSLKDYPSVSFNPLDPNSFIHS